MLSSYTYAPTNNVFSKLLKLTLSSDIISCTKESIFLIWAEGLVRRNASTNC